jgi:hypothetical protein
MYWQLHLLLWRWRILLLMLMLVLHLLCLLLYLLLLGALSYRTISPSLFEQLRPCSAERASMTPLSVILRRRLLM